jgi:hypothetical protein
MSLSPALPVGVRIQVLLLAMNSRSFPHICSVRSDSERKPFRRTLVSANCPSSTCTVPSVNCPALAHTPATPRQGPPERATATPLAAVGAQGCIAFWLSTTFSNENGKVNGSLRNIPLQLDALLKVRPSGNEVNGILETQGTGCIPHAAGLGFKRTRDHLHRSLKSQSQCLGSSVQLPLHWWGPWSQHRQS